MDHWQACWPEKLEGKSAEWGSDEGREEGKLSPGIEWIEFDGSIVHQIQSIHMKEHNFQSGRAEL